VKAAFLANSFHLTKTRSTDFFIEMLRSFFEEVAVIPNKEAWAELPGKKWDLLVVFQKRYPPEELEAFGARSVVLVPMYDDCRKDAAFWAQYQKFKIFCFSSTLEHLLLSYGLQAWGVRYYPQAGEMTARSSPEAGLRGFFWPRVKAIDWNLVRTLIGHAEFSHFQFHWTPEIHSDLCPPSADEKLLGGGIVRSSWSGDRNAYLDLLSSSNVFFAPRTLEGIGMSFIEAMAMGLCVVAPNAPTMNEYIKDGVTGLLYDPQRPTELDYSRAKEIGNAARASCIEGRERWLRALPNVRTFLEEPPLGYRPRRHPAIALKGRATSTARRIYRLLKKI